MVEDDRYCLDVMQQINSLTAAAREVALIVLDRHAAPSNALLHPLHAA